jgi:hypothetical protein
MSKFNGDQNDRYDGELTWPGLHGIPFMGDGAVPNLRGPEAEQLPISGKARHKVFDLSNEEDNEYFQWVRDRCRNGLFTQDHIERHWNKETNSMVIYMEWTQLFRHAPIKQGGNGDGHQNGSTFTITSGNGDKNGQSS